MTMNAIAGKSLVVQLVEVVNEEVRVFQELLDHLHQEQAAIVNDDVETIEGVAAAKAELVETAKRLEGERQDLLQHLSESLNMAPGGVDLVRLIETVESHHGEELARMRETLLDLNQKIRDTNHNNGYLIRQSMRYTDRCLEILTGNPQDRGLYGKFGRARKRNAGDRSVLNRMA
ncbi:flagella synthesis protein FlgN [Candidatus Latescibacterota bacterium]